LSVLVFAAVSRWSGHATLGTAVIISACLAWAWRVGGPADDPEWSKANHVPFWAAYNFKGVEALREGHVVGALADRLRGTPGRLAQDLHPGNEWLGSSRVFEVMPHLAGKAILEGGLVNSALGSLAAYTVQGEISDAPAGWPRRVRPRRFDPASGLRHLEFMGVRQFVARSRRVQAALAADSGWREAGVFGGGKWRLFESTLSSAAPVRVWSQDLRAFATEDVQGDLLAWMYVPAAVREPMVLVPRGAAAPVGVAVASGEAYQEALAGLAGQPPPEPGWLDACSVPVEDWESGMDGSLRFTTRRVGEPHVLAMTYDPLWRVCGADAVHLVGPGYCVVYPTRETVTLRFRRGWVERVGLGLGFAGLLALVTLAVVVRRQDRPSESGAG